ETQLEQEPLRTKIIDDKIEDKGKADPDDNSTKCNREEIPEQTTETAADSLEDQIGMADVDGDIDNELDDDRVHVTLGTADEDSELGTVVGKERRTLGAMQELSRRVVQTQTGQRSWLMLDIDGFRNNRREELIKKAKRAIEQVKDGGEEFAFKPMNSFERKI